MGCDIHLYAEARDSEDAPWRSINAMEEDEVYDDETGEVTGTKLRPSRFYSGRNYALFGVLAGMRWTCPHGAIAEDRGAPEDISPEIRQEMEDWAGDGHSHSYATLAELIQYDWTKSIPQEVTVGSKAYARWRQFGQGWGEHHPDELYGTSKSLSEHIFSEKYPEGGLPTIAPGEMTGRYESAMVRYRTEKKDLWKILEDEMGDARSRMSFPVPLYTMFRTFLGETIPKLHVHGKPENVRIVFWFDN